MRKIILPKPTGLTLPERRIFVPRVPSRYRQRGFIRLMPSLGLWNKAFAVHGVDLNGSTDYLERVGQPSGVTNDHQCSLCIWIRPDGDPATGSLFSVFDNLGNDFHHFHRLVSAGNNRLDIKFADLSGNFLFTCDSSLNFLNTGSWHNILFSIDISTSTARLYIDDVNRIGTPSFIAGDPIGWSALGVTNRWRMGAEHGGANKCDGGIAELWLSHDTYIDFSQEANRRKFITAEGNPVDLGLNGEHPLGSAQLLYHSIRAGGSATHMQDNRGSGGGSFGTYAGTPAVANTSPGD
jgi:hypothetical protein